MYTGVAVPRQGKIFKTSLKEISGLGRLRYKGSAVTLGMDPRIKNDDFAVITGRPDQSADTLTEF